MKRSPAPSGSAAARPTGDRRDAPRCEAGSAPWCRCRCCASSPAAGTADRSGERGGATLLGGGAGALKMGLATVVVAGGDRRGGRDRPSRRRPARPTPLQAVAPARLPAGREPVRKCRPPPPSFVEADKDRRSGGGHQRGRIATATRTADLIAAGLRRRRRATSNRADGRGRRDARRRPSPGTNAIRGRRPGPSRDEVADDSGTDRGGSNRGSGGSGDGDRSGGGGSGHGGRARAIPPAVTRAARVAAQQEVEVEADSSSGSSGSTSGATLPTISPNPSSKLHPSKPSPRNREPPAVPGPHRLRTATTPAPPADIGPTTIPMLRHLRLRLGLRPRSPDPEKETSDGSD